MMYMAQLNQLTCHKPQRLKVEGLKNDGTFLVIRYHAPALPGTARVREEPIGLRANRSCPVGGRALGVLEGMAEAPSTAPGGSGRVARDGVAEGATQSSGMSSECQNAKHFHRLIDVHR